MLGLSRKDILPIRVTRLTEKYVSRYNDYLLCDDTTLFYASNKYRLLLRELLAADDHYLMALDSNDQIIGVLPAFIMNNRKYGAVLNSLPFYGSNGSIIEYCGNSEVCRLLLKAFYELAEQNNCASATIISSPLDNNREFLESEGTHTYCDKRIGQITQLPLASDNISDVLMCQFSESGRRNIRKAIKNNVEWSSEMTSSSLRFLADTHHENIKAKGGMPKPESFFELIPKHFENGRDYDLYTAFMNGKTIAALLLFYFNKTVEYFTPVVLEEFRSYQPLSMLIFAAMQDAVRKGFKWWNWGGTWNSQNSLYKFKRKWGSEDRHYYYYTNVFNPTILTQNKEELIMEYPYFYVIPFESLNPQ